MIQTFFYSRNLFFALQRYKKQPLKRTVSNDLCIFDLIFTNKTNGDVDCNASVPS